MFNLLSVDACIYNAFSTYSIYCGRSTPEYNTGICTGLTHVYMVNLLTLQLILIDIGSTFLKD